MTTDLEKFKKEVIRWARELEELKPSNSAADLERINKNVVKWACELLSEELKNREPGSLYRLFQSGIVTILHASGAPIDIANKQAECIIYLCFGSESWTFPNKDDETTILK